LLAFSSRCGWLLCEIATHLHVVASAERSRNRNRDRDWNRNRGCFTCSRYFEWH